jgi:hypothetical protein
MAALEEVRTLADRDRLSDVADLLQHARELLDIVDEELTALDDTPTVAQATIVAKAMRERLRALEGTLNPLH